MSNRISEQCFDIAIGLYACNDSTLEDCGKIRRLVAGLEAERDAARAEVERLREALTDMLAGWRYIRQEHGDLYGVGWDRAEEKARKALARHKETP